jgi:hypothetical protein
MVKRKDKNLSYLLNEGPMVKRKDKDGGVFFNYSGWSIYMNEMKCSTYRNE